MASTILSGSGITGGVKYDKPNLKRQKFTLAELQANSHLPRLAQLISVGGMKLTVDCFRNERDSYGLPWKPLARERSRDHRARIAREKRGLKSRGHQILTDTARMRNSTAPFWHGNQCGVTIATGYAAVHQHGAHINPHSRLAGAITFEARLSGRNRFVSKSQRSKLLSQGISVRQHAYRRTYAQGITIPQRMMLPDSSLLPKTWHAMISRESNGLLKRFLKKGVAQ
jgi:phage gpG-like protein